MISNIISMWHSIIKNYKSDTPPQKNIFDTLPEEIVMRIFRELDCKDLSRASSVSRNFWAIANDNQLWLPLGRAIGLKGQDFANNPQYTVKHEIKKIKRQAIASGIEKPSLNTPKEINQTKFQILKKDYENLQESYLTLTGNYYPHKTPPESIQKLLNCPATLENLVKLERWLLARSTVIVYEQLKRENNNLTGLTASLLEGDRWEEIFNSYAEWSKKNQNELQKITKLHLGGQGLLKLPPRIFNELISLKILGLSRNQLSELPGGIFDELKSLKILGLFHNQLSELPNLDNLKSLERLVLSDNQLSELPNLDTLESLWMLLLAGNKIDIDDPTLKKLRARIRAEGLNDRSLNLASMSLRASYSEEIYME